MDRHTEGFEVFVAVVDAGSISAAARALQVPRETLSRRFGRLEERMGVRLAHRGPRRLALTPAGATLYERATRIVQAAVEAEEAVRRLDDVPRGLLRVSAPSGAASQLITGMLVTFLEAYPEVQVELLSTNRFVDLIGERVDVALRGGEVTDPNLIARRLWSAKLVAVAAPAYLDVVGRPTEAADLSALSCVLGSGGGERPVRVWPCFDGGTVAVRGRFACSELDAMLVAAIRGVGVALVPRPAAEEALARGELEVVLEGVVGRQTWMSLVYAERALMPAKLRAFVDHATTWFRNVTVDDASRARFRSSPGSV